MSVTVAIHQPEFLPWLGFIDKLRQSDIFVLLDTVQFEKNYFQSRNRIRNSQGEVWLTVPVHHQFDTKIQDVEIDNTHRWSRKILRSVEMNYHNAPYFSRYYPSLEDIFRPNWRSLSLLNGEIIMWMARSFGLRRQITYASELKVSGFRSELLAQICQKLDATTYLSGVSGRDYLNESFFTQANVEVRYQEFVHPIYTQCYDPFISRMSGIDLLFNHGPNSLGVLCGSSSAADQDSSDEA